MDYRNIVKARFIKRENRFVALVSIGDGGQSTEKGEVKVHVRNTGRCKELLVPGCTVYLEDFSGRMGNRKMRYSLVAVEKERAQGGPLLINMDSQAPNKVVHEALKELSSGEGSRRRLILPGMEGVPVLIRPERKFGSSRLDFYVETGCGDPGECVKAFIEVKGVTLEENGVARFPDAPTERGLKHVNELIEAVKKGYRAYIVFIVQMKGVHVVEPNYETQPEFGKALKKAESEGVHIAAYDCAVRPDSLKIDRPLKVDLL